MMHVFEWVNRTQGREVAAWDEFVRHNPRGHYCAYSTWLDSFAPYGFEYEILVAREKQDQTVAGGCGVLRFGIGPLKLLVMTVGPLVAQGQEFLAVQFLERLEARAREQHAAFVQFQAPVARDAADDGAVGLLPRSALTPYQHARDGQLLKVGLPAKILNLVSLEPDQTREAGEQALLTAFSKSTRRDIRWAERNVPPAYFARTAEELRDAYAVIEANGRMLGYATRSWQQFGPALQRQVQLGQAEVVCVRVDGRVVGSGYLVIAGQRMTYMMGGALRLKPDLRVGVHAHWAAMRRGRELGLTAYDLTALGSSGVAEFKLGFRPRVIALAPPGIIDVAPFRTAVFRRALETAYRHKADIARWLAAARRLMAHG